MRINVFCDVTLIGPCIPGVTGSVFTFRAKQSKTTWLLDPYRWRHYNPLKHRKFMPNAQHHVPEHLDLQQHHCDEPRSNKDNLLILQTQAIKPCVFFIQKFSQGIKHIMFALKNTVLGTCCLGSHVNINYCSMFLTEFRYSWSLKKSLLYLFMVKASNIIKYFSELHWQ
jgi:hypothetical protein